MQAPIHITLDDNITFSHYGIQFKTHTFTLEHQPDCPVNVSIRLMSEKCFPNSLQSFYITSNIRSNFSFITMIIVGDFSTFYEFTDHTVHSTLLRSH